MWPVVSCLELRGSPTHRSDDVLKSDLGRYHRRLGFAQGIHYLLIELHRRPHRLLGDFHASGGPLRP